MGLIIKKIESLDSNLLNQIAKMHKIEMKSTVATIISIDDLVRIYNILLRHEKIEIFYLENGKSVIGAVILENKNRIRLGSYFLLSILIFKYFFSYPLKFLNLIFTRNIYKYFYFDKKILAIFISSSYQGYNYGTLLIDFLFNSKNYKNIILDTDKDNHNARSFYLKNRFKEIKKYNNKIIFLRIS